LRLPEPVLRIVLGTLLVNAFAHGAPNSVVSIDLAGGRLRIRNASDDLPSDFEEPFVKGGSSTGSGLGLSIARRLLERHGGTLEVIHRHGCTSAWIGDARSPSGRLDSFLSAAA
jgi:signal transduction histidine kinase